MALSENDKVDTTRKLIIDMFVEAGVTANLTVADVRAAIDYLDTYFGNPVNTGVQALENNIVAGLPEPFKSGTNLAQKSLALAYWAMKRGGII